MRFSAKTVFHVKLFFVRGYAVCAPPAPHSTEYATTCMVALVQHTYALVLRYLSRSDHQPSLPQPPAQPPSVPKLDVAAHGGQR